MAGKGNPPSGGGIDPRIKALLDNISERVDVLSDRRGDPLDRALTPRDLLDLGLAKRIGRSAQRLVSGGNLVASEGPASQAIPPSPTGFEVSGGLSHIFLEWDNAREAYGNHGYTAIFRNSVDNLANAVEVAQTTSSFNFADMDVHFGVNYYYWIRFVSASNVMGPPNSPAGTLGKVAEDPAELLERLSGEIGATQLAADLRTQIDSYGDEIAALEDLYGDTANAAQSAADAALSAAAAIQSEAAALQAKNEAIVAAGSSLTQANAATSSATEAATALSNATIKANEAASSASSASGSASSASSSAIAASNSATAAGNSASASSSSANSASSSATAAGTAAAAANQSKLDAQTALSGAQAAQSAAVTAKNDAAGSASAASSSASLAVNAKNDAAGSASAASTSASNAASSASAAGTSATAANQSKLDAQTANSSAQSAQSAAVSAKNDAQNSAAQAGYAWEQSVNSANSSASSALASAGSATTSQTQATNSANSASAANTAKVAAESARDAALGSANAASTSASTASTKADEAATSASSASTSANTASTKASEALTYRNQAATSESNAAGYAAASAVDYTAITARLNNVGGLTIEQKFDAQANSITGLYGQYTLKIDVNGRVSGFGLASTNTASTFIINADKFAIGKPGATGSDIYPFIVDTTTGAVVMQGAFIKNATIGTAQIGDAVITSAKIVDASVITAKISDAAITTAKITDAAITGAKIQDAAIGSAKIANVIQSSNYNPGVAGWQIKKNGEAEFNGIVISRANVIGTGTFTTPAGVYQYDSSVTGQWLQRTRTDRVSDGSGGYTPSTVYEDADINNFYADFLIDTTYDNGDEIFDLSSASFAARVQVLTSNSANYGATPPPVGTVMYAFDVDARVTFKTFHSIGAVGSPPEGESSRRAYIHARIFLRNINPVVYAVRIGSIKWALHRLT